MNNKDKILTAKEDDRSGNLVATFKPIGEIANVGEVVNIFDNGDSGEFVRTLYAKDYPELYDALHPDEAIAAGRKPCRYLLVTIGQGWYDDPPGEWGWGVAYRVTGVLDCNQGGEVTRDTFFNYSILNYPHLTINEGHIAGPTNLLCSMFVDPVGFDTSGGGLWVGTLTSNPAEAGVDQTQDIFIMHVAGIK